MNKTTNIIFYIFYLFLGFLHLFLVKDVPLLLFLVVIFEALRLFAFSLKIKFIIGLLAIFSCIFIIANYKNIYDANLITKDNKEVIAKNIANYTSKYWVSGDKFDKLITEQKEILKSSQNLPNFYLIAALIILIEVSLAYMTIFGFKKLKPIEKSIVDLEIANINNAKSAKFFDETTVSAKESTQQSDLSTEHSGQSGLNSRLSLIDKVDCPLNSSQLNLLGIEIGKYHGTNNNIKLEKLGNKFYKNKQPISKSYYYQLLQTMN